MKSATKSLAAALSAVILASAIVGSPPVFASDVPALKKAANEPLKAVMDEPDLMPATGQDSSAAAVPANPFTHRYFRPEKPNGETIVLLHGSGGDETSLVELARGIAPNALLLGVRGRILQDGIQRWYRRVSPVSFDQADIRAQADAFARFFRDAVKAEKIDLAKTTFLGYSNGANLVGALTLLHPDMIRKAVLLRAMPVLDKTPRADLSKARFLTVAGDEDVLYSPFAPKLEQLLRGHGAKVDARTIHSGHLLGDEDVKVIAEWMTEPVLASTRSGNVE